MVNTGFSIPCQCGNPAGHRHMDGSRRVRVWAGFVGLPSPAVIKPIMLPEQNFVTRDLPYLLSCERGTMNV